MRKISIIFLLSVLLIPGSCSKSKTAIEILDLTISTIDTIETIYYKQDMIRSNPRKPGDTISRYREMYFRRLVGDSIVGVKGHWYMYSKDKTEVSFEDIYDGNRLVRTLNATDSLARLYDLEKYPAFRDTHFWSHNTLYGMQYEFGYILKNQDLYSIERLNDTVIRNMNCYQISIRLKNFSSMPGFAYKPEESPGSVSINRYFIAKENYYPVKIIGTNFSEDQPDQAFFIDQTYFDIKFNIDIDENSRFNTSDDFLQRYKVKEMLP